MVLRGIHFCSKQKRKRIGYWSEKYKNTGSTKIIRILSIYCHECKAKISLKAVGPPESKRYRDLLKH